MMAQIAALQKDIETAITKEEYEIAARLRDQIKQLQEDAAQLKGAGVEP
jgi:protein-arginine kinase activator protein McsA